MPSPTLRSRIPVIDRKFIRHWKHYISQSFCAALAIFIVLLFLSMNNAGIIIASIGASAFIVFAMPNKVPAQPRNVIGGHSVGLLCGLFFAGILVLLSHEPFIVRITLYSLAVGLAMFSMVILDTEHPPAAGTALGVVAEGVSPDVVVAILGSAVILSVIHRTFRPYLKDLT